MEGAGEGLVVRGKCDVIVYFAKSWLYHVGVVVAVGWQLLYDVICWYAYAKAYGLALVASRCPSSP